MSKVSTSIESWSYAVCFILLFLNDAMWLNNHWIGRVTEATANFDKYAVWSLGTLWMFSLCLNRFRFINFETNFEWRFRVDCREQESLKLVITCLEKLSSEEDVRPVRKQTKQSTNTICTVGGPETAINLRPSKRKSLQGKWIHLSHIRI